MSACNTTSKPLLFVSQLKVLYEEVEDVKGEKTILGGLKGVPYKDFEAVKRTAMKVDQISAERDRALARVKNQIRELMLQKQRQSRSMQKLTDSLK